MRISRSFGATSDQHAVVLLRLADAPLLEQAVGVLLDRHAVERLDGRDGDLGRGLLFELIEPAIDLGLGGRIDHVGEVVDAAGRLGKGLRGATRK